MVLRCTFAIFTLCSRLIRTMRSWKGRNEVDTMDSLLLRTPLDHFPETTQSVLIEELDFNSLQRYKLDEIFENSSPSFGSIFDIEDIPIQIRDEWKEINDRLNSVIKQEYGSIPEYCKKCINALNKSAIKIKNYELKNHKIISQEFRLFIRGSQNSIEVFKRMYLSILFASNRILRSRNGSRKIESINIYLEYVYSELIPSIQGKNISLSTLFFLSETLESITSSDGINSILNLKSSTKTKHIEEFNSQSSRYKENIKIIKLIISYFREIISRYHEFSRAARDKSNNLLNIDDGGMSLDLNTSEVNSLISASLDESVQAFIDTYDEWSKIYDNLAAR